MVAGRGKGGKMGGRNSCWVGMDKHTLLYLKWINKDLLYIAQGTLLNVMCQTGLVGGGWGEDGYMYMYGRVPCC